MTDETQAEPSRAPSVPPIAPIVIEAFRSLLRAPFRVIFLLALLASVVADTLTEGWGGLILLVVSLYLQIATTLAAGAVDPDPSADAWVKAAFRRRCFLRYFLTGLAVFFIVAAPALLLATVLGTETRAAVVAAGAGGFAGAALLGGLFALAQPASAIERLWPGEAIRRSLALSDPARKRIAVVFVCLILLPVGAIQTGYALGWPEDLGPAWIPVTAVGVIAGMWGAISLTRIYVALSGKTTPALENIAPRPAVRG